MRGLCLLRADRDYSFVRTRGRRHEARPTLREVHTLRRGLLAGLPRQQEPASDGGEDDGGASDGARRTGTRVRQRTLAEGATRALPMPAETARRLPTLPTQALARPMTRRPWATSSRSPLQRCTPGMTTERTYSRSRPWFPARRWCNGRHQMLPDAALIRTTSRRVLAA